MADLKKFEQSLDAMVNLLLDMKKSLVGEPTPTSPITVQQTQTQPLPVVDLPNVGELDTFEQLKKAVESDKWPEAVNPNLICNPDSEDDKVERARGIVELMIEDDLKDLRFLDFGCGEGHAAVVAKEYSPAMSVGFDIKANPKWNEFPDNPNVRLTTDFEQVKELGPYNVILLFDVIDHAENESPVNMLAKCKSVLAPGGKIYMRTHPFTSRHATHHYHTLNKAFIHLVFSPEELNQLVPDAKHAELRNIGVVYPIKTYGEFITNAGLKIVTKREVTEKVEPFFRIPKIAERIMKSAKQNKFPDFQMGMQFIDYNLSA